MSHIAMLTGSLQKGGSERVLVNLTGYLSEQKNQITMVTTYVREDEYPLPEGVKRVISDITAEETGKSRIGNFIRRFNKLRNIWKTEKPDLILSFIGKNNMMAILTSWGLKIPVVVSVRGEPNQEYYTGWMRFAARHLFARAAGVVLQTRDCMDFFPEKVCKKAVILKNPLNPLFLCPRFDGERNKEIVAVGRVDENKNHTLLIQAFSEIAEQFPDYKLVIYGDGDKRSQLQKLVEDLQLSGQISLPGSISDVKAAIYEASVFVLPSNTEGVPNTLIEAMAMGLTVISTDCPCGGPASLIENGENGILIPVNGKQELKENLQKVLNDLQYATGLGMNATKTGAIYNPREVNREWEQYLEACMRRE